VERYTLKLDAAWKPIDIVDGFKGFNMCYTGRANVVLKYSDGFFPAVIVLKEYIRKDFTSYSCNRKNVIWRDKYICQYCGNKFQYHELTMDHVIPKSRGGEKSWTNIVASCKGCNSKKGNKTPKEARMPLIKKPTIPRWNINVLLRDKEIPNEWKDFI
jgi:hypothetical protein|tara:strand:+ start:253 stop:726 length:474 start_codon:yes stop_codon:yes gene_type:complete